MIGPAPAPSPVARPAATPTAGAGGTASLSRAIGRHRLMWLALGAFRIGAPQALDWGLIHAIEP